MMDLPHKLFLQNHWFKNKQEKYEIAQFQSKETGFFCNPEFVKSFLDHEKNTVTVTDEAFEESLKFVENYHKDKVVKKKKKHK